jgi:hypothetical protein
MALGNINLCMMKGAKVFLHEKNPIYGHLKQHGIKLFSLSEFQKSNDLTMDEAIKNCQIIQSMYSYEALQHKTNLLINEIQKV